MNTPNFAALLEKALNPKSTDRSERYCARVDAHLPTLPHDPARHAFLQAELAKWQDRYTAWAERVDSGREPVGPDHPTAFDFVITIAELDRRLAQFRAVAAVAP